MGVTCLETAGQPQTTPLHLKDMGVPPTPGRLHTQPTSGAHFTDKARLGRSGLVGSPSALPLNPTCPPAHPKIPPGAQPVHPTLSSGFHGLPHKEL